MTDSPSIFVRIGPVADLDSHSAYIMMDAIKITAYTVALKNSLGLNEYRDHLFGWLVKNTSDDFIERAQLYLKWMEEVVILHEVGHLKSQDEVKRLSELFPEADDFHHCVSELYAEFYVVQCYKNPDLHFVAYLASALIYGLFDLGPNSDEVYYYFDLPVYMFEISLFAMLNTDPGHFYGKFLDELWQVAAKQNYKTVHTWLMARRKYARRMLRKNLLQMTGYRPPSFFRAGN